MRHHEAVSTDRFINRELSWLDFNARVLSLADAQLEPWAGWVRTGYLDDLRGRARWTRANRHLVE